MADYFVVAKTDENGETTFEKVETPEYIGKMLHAEEMIREQFGIGGSPLKIDPGILEAIRDQAELAGDGFMFVWEGDWCGTGTGRPPIVLDPDRGPIVGGGGDGLWGPDQPIDPDNPINPWADAVLDAAVVIETGFDAGLGF